MKKGYVFKDHPDHMIDDWDFTWHYGAIGGAQDGIYDPFFIQRWSASNPFKRGVILVPKKSANDNVNDNASFHLQLLQEIYADLKNTSAPIIIDYLAATGAARFTPDDLIAYITYIKDKWQTEKDSTGKIINPTPIKNKILLRASLAVWNTWITTIPAFMQAVKIVEPLVARWDAPAIGTVTTYGVPAWWEYAQGLIANDDTKTWATHPAGTVTPVTPPVTPEPEPEPTEADNSQPAKKYRVHGTLGGAVIDVLIEPIE